MSSLARSDQSQLHALSFERSKRFSKSIADGFLRLNIELGDTPTTIHGGINRRLTLREAHGNGIGVGTFTTTDGTFKNTNCSCELRTVEAFKLEILVYGHPRIMTSQSNVPGKDIAVKPALA